MEAKLRRLGATSELLTGAINRAERRRQATLDRKAHKKIQKKQETKVTL